MKEIKLTQGKIALVDDEDFDWLNQWKWVPLISKANTYAVRSVYKNGGKKTVYMHRVILAAPNDRTILVDHKDGIGLHNYRDNIRICSRQENNANKKVSSKKKTSKYKGVTFYKKINAGTINGYWVASVAKNGTLFLAGTHETEVEAALAYNKKAIEIHGEFAKLNIIKK